MSLEGEENELELKGFLRLRTRTIRENCVSYLLKEDLNPFSNFEIEYLNKVYKDRDLKLFIRKVVFGENKLKLYVVEDKRIEKLSKAENLNLRDTKIFHQDILVCGLDTTFIEGKKIELKGNMVLVYFKDVLKENLELKEFLSKISNQIIEMNEDFKIIMNKEELFLNSPITLNVNIDNRNGNFLNTSSNSIELFESVKNFQNELENVKAEMREFILKVVNFNK